MFLSRRDKIALLVAILAGGAVVFVLRYAGWGASYALFAFDIFAVPFIAYISDGRRFLVWQVCILTSVACLIGGILSVGGETFFDVLQPAFVFWATGTILSSPAPIHWFFRKVDKSKRIILLVPIAVSIVVLYLMVKLITH